MGIELVGHAEPAESKVPRFADVPAEHAIRGFFGVTMLERAKAGTEAALALLGFRLMAEEGNRMRFSADGDALGNHLDVVVDPNASRGRIGAGTVHHIAFRSADYEDQKEWLAKISQSLSSSPVMERDSSAPSTSASREACSLSWPPTSRASQSTSRWSRWASNCAFRTGWRRILL